MLKTLDESLELCVENIISKKIADKYEVGKSGPTFRLDTKTIGKGTLKQAETEILERGYTNVKKYTHDKTTVYYVIGDKIIAKIFCGMGMPKVAMCFHSHPDLPIKEKK